MRLQDIRLVPIDADRATVHAYLDAEPRWELLSTHGTVAIYGRDGNIALSSVVRIPTDDDPMFAEETAEMVAEAAITINAILLDLPTNTPAEAVRRLVEIANLASAHKPGTIRPAFTPTRVHAVATGQEVAR